MKNRLFSKLVLASVIIVQGLVLSGMDNSEAGLSFCTYYNIESNIVMRIHQTLFVYMPIPFILFSFQDNTNDLTKGYAKLLIVRNYSRTVIFVKVFLKNALQGAGIVLAMTALSWILEGNTRDMKYTQVFHSALVYWLMILAIIALEILIEMLIGNQQIANLLVNVYVVISLLGDLPLNSPLAGVCFPRMAFTESRNMDEYSLITIMLIVFITVIVGFLGGAKYRRMDIL